MRTAWVAIVTRAQKIVKEITYLNIIEAEIEKQFPSFIDYEECATAQEAKEKLKILVRDLREEGLAV